MAAAYGNDDMVKLLLDRGADAGRMTPDGLTVLDFAIRGATDIDRFTLLDCQYSTVALLVRRHPELSGTARSSTRTVAFLKRCHP
jgi:ankyrin repeat protein